MSRLLGWEFELKLNISPIFVLPNLTNVEFSIPNSHPKEKPAPPLAALSDGN